MLILSNIDPNNITDENSIINSSAAQSIAPSGYNCSLTISYSGNRYDNNSINFYVYASYEASADSTKMNGIVINGFYIQEKN